MVKLVYQLSKRFERGKQEVAEIIKAEVQILSVKSKEKDGDENK